MDLTIIDLVLAIFITSHCIIISVISFLRFKTNNNKSEIIVFSILCIATACWALTPIFNPMFRLYGWLSGLFIVNIATYYTIIVTYKKLIKYFIPVTIIMITAILTLLFLKTKPGNLNAQVKYTIIVYPTILFMNFLFYHFFYKHKTEFHLSLGIVASLMIIGGIYETFKFNFNLPQIPVISIASFVFILIIGYNIIIRGYLDGHGWRDYEIELENKEYIIKERFNELKKANLDTILVLSQTIEAKDPYTRGHCLRVRDYSKAIGQELGFDKDRLFNLEIGALLHDIGKIGIPGSILNKSSNLSDNEFEIVKEHSEIGANILKQIEFFNPIVKMIRHHHEYWNGNGYPDKLKGEKIPIESRIISVSDIYDALTSLRPFRSPFSPDEAIEILKKYSGSQLDPNILKIFLDKKIYQISKDNNQKLDIEF